jgi:hypothetical protein
MAENWLQKNWLLAAIVVVLVLMVFGVVGNPFAKDQTPANNGGTNGGTDGSSNTDIDQDCQYAPAYTYPTVDALSGAAVTTTSNIKLNGDYPVTTLAAPTKGSQLDVYWNATDAICQKYTGTSKCGNFQVQGKCYLNGTATLSVYDNNAHAALTAGGGATNVTIGAGGSASLEFDYLQGTYQKAGFPLGGCIFVEIPTEISSVTIGGEGITSGCPYPVTYSAAAGQHYKTFTIPANFDIEASPITKKMTVGLQATSTNPSDFANITMYAANYYTGTDGNFYLGIEKDKNGDTTKTSTSTKTTSFKID